MFGETYGVPGSSPFRIRKCFSEADRFRVPERSRTKQKRRRQTTSRPRRIPASPRTASNSASCSPRTTRGDAAAQRIMAKAFKTGPPQLLANLPRLRKMRNGVGQIIVGPTAPKMKPTQQWKRAVLRRYVRCPQRQNPLRRTNQLKMNHAAAGLQHPEKFPQRRPQHTTPMKIANQERGRNRVEGSRLKRHVVGGGHPEHRGGITFQLLLSRRRSFWARNRHTTTRPPLFQRKRWASSRRSARNRHRECRWRPAAS